MTIYEEVHLQKHYANNTFHTHFLRKLRSILAENCRPIVVTGCVAKIFPEAKRNYFERS